MMVIGMGVSPWLNTYVSDVMVGWYVWYVCDHWVCIASFNPDQLPEDELPMVGDERSEFTNRLDMDHDGMLNYEEIKEWLVPDDVEFFQEEAQHLISHADKDEVRLVALEL